MGKALRKIKRERSKSISPLNPKLMEAWNKGFSAGVKAQKETDIEHLVKILEGLEEIPGIGEKTAWKIREFFLNQFGGG